MPIYSATRDKLPGTLTKADHWFWADVRHCRAHRFPFFHLLVVLVCDLKSMLWAPVQVGNWEPASNPRMQTSSVVPTPQDFSAIWWTLRNVYGLLWLGPWSTRYSHCSPRMLTPPARCHRVCTWSVCCDPECSISLLAEGRVLRFGHYKPLAAHLVQLFM